MSRSRTGGSSTSAMTSKVRMSSTIAGCGLLPGFIDCHAHVAMIDMRSTDEEAIRSPSRNAFAAISNLASNARRRRHDGPGCCRRRRRLPRRHRGRRGSRAAAPRLAHPALPVGWTVRLEDAVGARQLGPHPQGFPLTDGRRPRGPQGEGPRARPARRRRRQGLRDRQLVDGPPRRGALDVPRRGVRGHRRGGGSTGPPRDGARARLRGSNRRRPGRGRLH